jgi:hypothetical protein
MQHQNHHQLGQLMCQATHDILWQPACDSVRAINPGAGLHCRVGSGNATYHRFDSRSQQHRITYGVRMIRAKQEPETAQWWLSTREIQNRGYFAGEISPLNLLAHTCCHEFAHLLQHNAGHRHYRSVHNRHFYRILDDLHQSGQAETTRAYLAERAGADEIPLEQTPFTLPDPHSQAHQWQVGDEITFQDRSTHRHGRILRVNRKTCTVQGLGVSAGRRYRVPLALLSHVNF